MGPKTRSADDTSDFITRDDLNMLLNSQRETILACFRESVSVFVETINKRVDKLANDVQDIKTSMNFTDEVTQKKIKTVNDHVDRLKDELKGTKTIQQDLVDSSSGTHTKIVDLEDRSRRCNIQDSKNETAYRIVKMKVGRRQNAR